MRAAAFAKWQLGLVAFASAASAAAPEEMDPAAQRFVPAGWNVVLHRRGELGGDRGPETVLVIQGMARARLIPNGGLGPDVLDTNPRRLIVLAGSAGGLRQIAASDHLIPPQGSEDSPCLADPLEDGDVRIEHGILHVDLHYWLSCGSYGVTNRRYKFRLEQGQFRLIGFDRLEFSRSSGEGEERSVDYLRGRIKRTPGIAMFDDDAARPAKVSWSRFAPQRLRLEDLRIAECNNLDPAPGWC